MHRDYKPKQITISDTLIYFVIAVSLYSSMLVQSASINYSQRNVTEITTNEGEKTETALARTRRSDDARSSYYEFLITEGSYKFWAVFQVFTACLLIYSAFAAIWYAKYTFATTDYPEYDDDFFFRRSGEMHPVPETVLGISGHSFQTILDSIYSNKYS